MAEDKNTLVGDTQTTTPKEETTEEKVILTKEEHQAQLDSIAQKVRAEEKAKQESLAAKIRAEQKAEDERLAKLSQEQRDQELKSKQEQEYKERERSVALRENRQDVYDNLVDRKLPADKEVVEMLTREDKEVSIKNVATFEKIFNDRVEKGIADRLAGNPPKDVDDSSKKSTAEVQNYF